MTPFVIQNADKVSPKGTQSIAEEFRAKQKQVSEFDKGLSELPAHIARTDRKISPDNAALTFVVVKEMHFHENLPKETKEAAVRCQAEVNVTLTTFKEKLGTYNVLQDGMDPDIEKSYSERIDHLYKHANTVKSLEDGLKLKTSAESEAYLNKLKITNADNKMINAVRFLMEYQKSREELFERAKTDSVINLALRKSITLKGPEDKTLVEKSLELTKNNPAITVDDPEFKALSDRREKHIIEQVAKEKGPIVVGVFGASHDFSEEIETWNKNNPGMKIALIEIVPAEYDRFIKE